MNPSLLCISFILALVNFPVQIRAKTYVKREVGKDKNTDMNSDVSEDELDDQVVKEEVEKDKKRDMNSDVTEEDLDDQEVVVKFKLYCTPSWFLLPYIQYLNASQNFWSTPQTYTHIP